MEQNEIIQMVIETVRKDILTNKDFLRSILSTIKLTEENIPTDLILMLMNQLGRKNKALARPVSKSPKRRASDASAPIVMGSDSLASKVVSDLLEGNNVFLVGKAGTGKTFLAEAIGKYIMGQPTFTINCSQWTSPIQIMGGQTIKGYQEGELIKAWAMGGLLILDELPKLDPNTAGLLNDALAKTAAQPDYDAEGKIIAGSIPYITNGRGDKVYKGQDQPDEDLKFRFCVIGTGNTDMMNVGNKYGGNQRQDYSLVDRFAGSYYALEVNKSLEMELIYPYVFGIADAIRSFLESKDALQSISLRTMLNFNRTYEQQKLYAIGSPFADEIYGAEDQPLPPKTLEDSIESFKLLLEKNMREQLEEYQPFRDARASNMGSDDAFRLYFKINYHLDPDTGDALTQAQVDALKKGAKKSK